MTWDDTRQEALLAAAADGDLDAVIRHFELPDVRANVSAWNAFHLQTRLGEPVEVPTDRPWHSGPRRDEELFTTAIVDGGQVDVFQWFLEPAQLELLGETLTVLATEIVLACVASKNTTASREMVEILVDSRVFTEIVDEQQCRVVFGEALTAATARGQEEWIEMLLAYGADVNYRSRETTPLAAVAVGCKTASTLYRLVSSGAWVVGEPLLADLNLFQAKGIVGELIRQGVDALVPVEPGGSVLHKAATDFIAGTVLELVQLGYADLDARDECGRTPMMVMAGKASHTHSGPWYMALRSTLRYLLLAGADIHAVDDHQRTALHHAVQRWNVACVRLLLERGANPNARDDSGRTPMISFLAGIYEQPFDPVMADVLRILLDAGAKPYIGDKDGLSSAFLLKDTEWGRAFVEENPTFF